MRPVTELVDFLSTYHDHLDGDQIKRAYAFGQEKHQHQTRASGEAYFSHPIEVAFILAHMRLDAATIITALLHDTIEDTDATFSDLQSAFGDEVSALVDGVTKLSRLELQSDQTMQAENFRKLLLAMSEDIRVLLVKLADRLHNMRTLQFIKNPEKRRRIAHETTEIYAPLAGRIGMDEMKHELEELAFQELHPQARDSITKRLAYLKEANIDIVPQLIKALTKVLSSQGRENALLHMAQDANQKH
jgi:guanosine-3',5'-bis(diphosphate) 3'-pyrophosphohydrolase